MGFEVDFLSVGDGSRSGDAIALRYSTPTGYEVMVVDGGTKDSGARLVEHVKGYYGTGVVAHAVNTHPDGDHSSGMTVVLEELNVQRLWMHRPWEYAEDIRHLFADGRITDNSLETTIREALQSAHDLEQTALKRKVTIVEPYQGAKIGPFTVLSPQKDWYLQELVPHFRGTPTPVADSAATTLMKSIADALKGAVEWVSETLDIETLKEGGETSAENESSVVMVAALDGVNKVLLTGDAGIQALAKAEEYAKSIGIGLNDLWLMQIPHHGSRNNVSPSILNKIKAQYATASAAKDDDLHPRRVVTNAFRRRGAKVYQTKGATICHHSGVEARRDWVDATPVPFFEQVEA